MTRGRMMIAALLVLAGAQSAAQEPASVSQAGNFVFRDDRSVAISLTIEGANGTTSIAWPDAAGSQWDTALLDVHVSADAAATLPYVEIQAAGRSDRQYFASGDSGRRWLNLSFLRGSVLPGTRVDFGGEGVAFSTADARLRLFATHPDLTRELLILAPHPDDAEIAAFGVYANRKASVVTVTAGNAGAPTYEAVFDDLSELYLFKGRIRLIDSITIPWQGGIPPERTFNMGYFDARLAEMYEKRDEVIPEMYRANSDIGVYRRENIGSLLPKRSRESKWSNLVEDTLTILRKVNPAVIVAPHPQLDTHRDHQFTTVALMEALGRWNKRVTLLLYTNHADQNRYPYGPAGTIVSLPPLPASAIEVMIDRVYSHPVPPSVQRLKLFALESMHDLRFSPTRQYQLARSEDRAIGPEKPGPEPDITYLRRAQRSNELFFVYDRDTFKAMVETFLTSRRTQ